jgi:hypothetical protein
LLEKIDFSSLDFRLLRTVAMVTMELSRVPPTRLESSSMQASAARANRRLGSDSMGTGFCAYA